MELRQRVEMVDLAQMVDLIFRGPPLRSTTFKLRQIKEIRQKWWTWWTLLLTLRAYAGAPAPAREAAEGWLRSTTSTE